MELDPDEAQERMKHAEKHANQRFEAHGITLLYIWDTWINGTELQTELDMFRHDLEGEDGLDGRAALLIAGTPAFWAAAFGGDDYIDIFIQGVNRLRGAIHQDLEHSIGFSNSYNGHTANQILVSPVLYPEYKDLNAERGETLTSRKLEHLNTLLAASSPELNSRVLWSYNSLTHGLQGAHDDIGVHVDPLIARNQFQVALNARCNNVASNTSPPRGTCCVMPPKRTPIQQLIGLPPALIFCARLLLWRLLKLSPAERAFGHILFILAWCWLADRSGVFPTIERHFEPAIFPLLCTAWIAFSLLSGKNTVKRKGRCTNLEGFLAREQSDEFKGLMQGIILIYHYTHNSKVLPVYKVIRLFIAMYIFLSAYGQSTYMLQNMRGYNKDSHKTTTPDTLKYRHAAAVLFRLNALTALLPISMITTNYFSYYFAPCVSFWFVVTWIALRIHPKSNVRPWALTVKVIVALLISHLVISAPRVLEWASRVSEWAFGLSWSASEMRFRLSLDRFVPFSGILVAGWNFQEETRRERSGIPEDPVDDPDQDQTRPDVVVPKTPTSESVASNDGFSLPRWLAFGSLLTIGLYSCIFVLPPPLGWGQTLDKYAYNALHPYVSPFVVVALLFLRNSTPGLRSSYLRLPTALGRISLETYVLQYHVWLANDATSILSLGLVDRYHGLFAGFASSSPPLAKGITRGLEACLLSVVFLTLAHLAHGATQVLGQWIFGSRKPRPGKGVGTRREGVGSNE